ncbi:MAG: DUF1405 domain-containing protein [Haloarculaceae archaeon]
MDAGRRLIPARWAQYYLGNAPSLAWLIFANVAAVVIGAKYYVATMPQVSTFLWPLYADSPAAVFLMALSLSTLLPFVGRRLSEVPRTRLLAYLHTLTFVWLVKMGLWTAVTLNLGFSAYFPEAWAYFGIILTHLGFVGEAFLVPHYGSTTRGALALALGLALFNDLLDYGFGLHPPIRYPVNAGLIVASVAISFLAVGLAAWRFDRLAVERAG